MKIKVELRNNKNAIMLLIFVAELATGFVFSGTKMSGASTFADISIAGASGLSGCAAVFMGSLLYSFLSGTIGRNIVKLAAMVLLLIAKLLMENKRDPRSCGIFTSVCVFLAGTAVSAVIGELLYKLIFYIFYSLLAGFTAYSAGRMINDLKSGRSADLTAYSGCFYAVVYTIYEASLCSVEIPLFNVGIVLGIAVTMLAVYYYSFTGGVLCGTLTACAAFLASPETGMTVVLLPAVGLFTGYLPRNRSSVTAAIFCGAGFMLMILTGMTENGVNIMINYILGAGIFLVISPYYSDKHIRTHSQYSREMPQILSRRSGFMSDSIDSIRRETSRLSEVMASRRKTEIQTEDGLAKVCGKCYRRHLCRKEGSTAGKGLKRLGEMMEISQETFPQELDTCIRRNELINARNKMIQSDTLSRLMDMRNADCRGLLSEQMKMAEDMIRAVGNVPKMRCSEPLSRRMRGKLEKFGFTPTYVTAYYNNVGRLLAEIYFSADSPPDSVTRVCDLISDELRISFSASEPVSSGKEVRLRLFEKPEYTLEVCTASRKAEGSDESGDTFMVFSDGTGTGYVLLSDGMGSGKEAAFESGLAASLFKRLTVCGADCPSVIKMVNSIMLTKSKEEAFATLDVLRFDLDSCGLTVIKSGSAPTLIRHCGNVRKVSAQTFPVGMYERSEAYIADCEFSEGDIAIMFSDGISENEYLFVKELLLGSSDLKSIVDEICSKSDKFNPNDRSDDVTVIGVRVVSA